MTNTGTLPPITRPSPAEVQKYLALWDEGSNAKLDVALRTLFTTMPGNTDVGEVAVKLAALNGLYSTNILALFNVAAHIAGLGIDLRLAKGEADPDLIEEIATVEFRGKTRRNYSFATKYCSRACSTTSATSTSICGWLLRNVKAPFRFQGSEGERL